MRQKHEREENGLWAPKNTTPARACSQPQTVCRKQPAVVRQANEHPFGRRRFSVQKLETSKAQMSLVPGKSSLGTKLPSPVQGAQKGTQKRCSRSPARCGARRADHTARPLLNQMRQLVVRHPTRPNQSGGNDIASPDRVLLCSDLLLNPTTLCKSDSPFPACAGARANWKIG